MQQNQNDLFQELQSLIKNINEELKQDSIVLIGPTGSGKTTISLFLEGVQLQKVSKHNQPRVDIQETQIYQKYKSRIGHDERGQTYQPQIYNNQDYTIIDTPGFLDNRGHDQQIKNALSNHLVFSSPFRKKLILVLGWGQINEKCGLDVHALMNNIVNILGLSEYDSIKNFGVIINKFKKSDFDGDVEIKEFIIQKFQSYFNESNRLIDQITPGNVFQQNAINPLRISVNTSYYLFLNLLKNAQYFTFTSAKKDKIPFNNVQLDQFRQWINNLEFYDLNPKSVRTYLNAETQSYFDDRYKLYIDQYKQKLEQEIEEKLKFIRRVIRKRKLLEASYESRSIVAEIEEFHDNIYNNRFRSQQVTYIKKLKSLSVEIYRQYFKRIGEKEKLQILKLHELDENIENSYVISIVIQDQYRQFIQQTNQELIIKNKKLNIMKQNIEKISYFLFKNIQKLYEGNIRSKMNSDICYQLNYIHDNMDQNLCKVTSYKQTCINYQYKLPYFGQDLQSLQQSFIIFNNLFQILNSSQIAYKKLDHQSYIDKIIQSHQYYRESRAEIYGNCNQILELIKRIEEINELKDFCMLTINTTNKLQGSRLEQIQDLILELYQNSNSFKFEQGIIDSEELKQNSSLNEYLQ